LPPRGEPPEGDQAQCIPLAGAFRCGDKWFAKITVNGRNYFLGVYDTRKEAVAAYRCAVRLLRGEFVRAKHRAADVARIA